MGWGFQFAPYVPVARRRAQAARKLPKLLKKGQAAAPVQIAGRAIATTFWAKAWCTNLEGYSDFANRLPRGRTYARNGSLVHLEIEKGQVSAYVSGSDLYKIKIGIAPLSKARWLAIKKKCTGRIGSLVELLQGNLSKEVMEQVSNRQEGLFPRPEDIRMQCSCPDYAGMCKHLAAVMYGIGHRLDSSPELLFLLRGVDHTELIEQALPATPRRAKRSAPTIAEENLGAIFGIEITDNLATKGAAAPRQNRASKGSAAKRPPAMKRSAAARKLPTTKMRTATKPPTVRKTRTARTRV